VIRLAHGEHPGDRESCAAFKIGELSLANARRRYAGRRERDELFGAALFAEPAWDVLLYLFIAAGEDRLISIREACAASSVPETTALRHIAHLKDRGLLQCRVNPADRRSSYLEVSNAVQRKMSLLLELSGPAADDPDCFESSAKHVIRNMQKSVHCAPLGSPRRHSGISRPPALGASLRDLGPEGRALPED
jgi:DNA-binding MarR family transcriptional regulator